MNATREIYVKEKSFLVGFSFITLAALTTCTGVEHENVYIPPPYDIEVMYDKKGLQPPIIKPVPQAGELLPPSDAIILFDGSDLSEWVGEKNNKAQWKIEKGYMEVVKDAGNIRTKQEFGSCQLHIEWSTPLEITGNGQDRGNSGVYLMSRYEIQVLDSYNNQTYPTGMAAAIYGQNPPLVNASHAPGNWQSYDIIFHRPIFKDNRVVKPANVTVFQNGILVQDNFEIMGPTVFKKMPMYQVHPDKQPIMLQDHENPVRFRNIWIRELKP